MKVSTHEQGTAEWKAERHGSIGGTSLKDLMSDKEVTDLALFYRILGERSEDYVDEETYMNKAMERGTELEPDAVQDAEQYLGLKFESFGVCKRDDLPFNHCSPDGFTADLSIGIEVKCPEASTHAKYLVKNELPGEYFWQCISYFLINEKMEKLHFVSYRPENKNKPLFIKTIERDTVLLFKIGTKKYELTVNDWVELAEERCGEFGEAVSEELLNQEF
tara:strand:- start:5202 stop:5861 length:660 start_codon:yes stop_codon:yes gene_type:complete